MAKWRLKVLEKDEYFVRALEIQRICNGSGKDIWIVKCGNGGDIDWQIIYTDAYGNTFSLRTTQKFSYQFVQSRCGFEPEDPWFSKFDNLIANAKKYGVKQTALDIIEYFADWKDCLLPEDLL